MEMLSKSPPHQLSLSCLLLTTAILGRSLLIEKYSKDSNRKALHVTEVQRHQEAKFSSFFLTKTSRITREKRHQQLHVIAVFEQFMKSDKRMREENALGLRAPLGMGRFLPIESASERRRTEQRLAGRRRGRRDGVINHAHRRRRSKQAYPSDAPEAVAACAITKGAMMTCALFSLEYDDGTHVFYAFEQQSGECTEIGVLCFFSISTLADCGMMEEGSGCARIPPRANIDSAGLSKRICPPVKEKK